MRTCLGKWKESSPGMVLLTAGTTRLLMVVIVYAIHPEDYIESHKIVGSLAVGLLASAGDVVEIPALKTELPLLHMDSSRR